MTAPKPLVPAELRELLTLMRDIAEPLPLPALGPDGLSAAGAWDRRRELEISRDSLVRSRLGSLVSQLAIDDDYPSVAAECLASYCQHSSEAIRQQIAEPLGYDPRLEPDGARTTSKDMEAGQ